MEQGSEIMRKRKMCVLGWTGELDCTHHMMWFFFFSEGLIWNKYYKIVSWEEFE